MRSNDHKIAEDILKGRDLSIADFCRSLHDMHQKSGSWRFVGQAIGYSGSHARMIAEGQRGINSRAVLRWFAFQNGGYSDTCSVPICPDCGSVHHTRCHGQPVAAVAVLAPGQTVATQRPPRQYSRLDQMPVSMLARAVKERHEYAVDMAP